MPYTRGAALAVAVAVAVCVLGVGGCSTDQAATQPSSERLRASTTVAAGADRYPDVTKVSASRDPNGTWAFEVTMTSPYDTPERYADGWRVKNGDRVLGEMTLGHDHASEQPFTRAQTGVEILDDVDSVTVEGHDLANGYGGAVVNVRLER